jgi:ABC-type transport system involved in multi-copper enzyme maturation permease subunit
MTATQAPAPPTPAVAEPAGNDGFGRILRAEWTKFHTVRGWLIGLLVGAVLMVFLGVFLANAQIGCQNNGVQETGPACLPKVPIGPGGEAVQDNYYFVRRSLTGDGSITARLTGLATRLQGNSGPAHPVGGPLGPAGQRVTLPWSKGGIMITASTKQGAAYAAMLATGSNGVRMQYNYTGDIAGLPGQVSAAAPRWLRLVRSGDTVTGYDSINGRVWITVGTVTLSQLPRTIQIGLFATSPTFARVSNFFGGANINASPTTTTAVINDVRLTGSTPLASWTGIDVGGSSQPGPPDIGGYHQAGGAFTVTGAGDIAPLEPGPGSNVPTATISQNLLGAFAALIAFVVVACTFMTSEYRRGLIRTTLAAAPRRGQVLAAKAIVTGLATFAVGLVAVLFCLTLGVAKDRREGLFVLPVSPLAEVRVIVGTAAMLGLMAVLAVCIAAILRRSAITITFGIVAIVLPFLFSVIGVFPAGVGDWLLRLAPAAGFAIQQSIPHYAQVASISAPGGGYYPLSPWAGFAVLLVWVAAAYVLALVLLRRRDA